MNYSYEFTGKVLGAWSSSPQIFCWLRASLWTCPLGSPVGVIKEYLVKVKQAFGGCWTLYIVTPHLQSCWWHASTASQGKACVEIVSTLGIPELGHHGVVLLASLVSDLQHALGWLEANCEVVMRDSNSKSEAMVLWLNMHCYWGIGAGLPLKAKEFNYLIWPGNAMGSPRRNWKHAEDLPYGLMEYHT